DAWLTLGSRGLRSRGPTRQHLEPLGGGAGCVAPGARAAPALLIDLLRCNPGNSSSVQPVVTAAAPAHTGARDPATIPVFMRSVRLAFRTLFKSPFVTAVAIISLALGIGANAAIYSLFDQLLLAPLPVHQPERLANLSTPGPKSGSTSCNSAGDCDVVFSYPMFRDIEKAQTAFSSVAAHRLFSANVAYEGETVSGGAVMVSGSYFGTLGLQPFLGRLLTPSDDQTVGAHFVAVLDHAFWEARLGADPGVVGRNIIVNGQPFSIVGIAPEGFHGTTVGSRPLLFVPITMRGVVNPGFQGFEN